MDTIPLSLPVLMDGATGTELYRRGMPNGVCTEQWVLEHPQALLEIQRAYVEAGSQVLIAPTFGANRVSLARHGAQDRVEEYNRRLVELTRTAASWWRAIWLRRACCWRRSERAALKSWWTSMPSRPALWRRPGWICS